MTYGTERTFIHFARIKVKHHKFQEYLLLVTYPEKGVLVTQSRMLHHTFVQDTRTLCFSISSMFRKR